jgi:SAM-dependent methyltransferase
MVMPFVAATAAVLVAFEEAKRLSGGRGIINLGCGPHRSYLAQEIAYSPDVSVNIDIALDGMPNFLQLDIERQVLPFRDKEFGCAFASHVLEHLDNWRFALDEMVRVADYVVIVLPQPPPFGGWYNREHRQLFSREDINEMAELYPTAVIYY